MKIAVIGFGMMGRQIAQVFAQNGFEVMATDEKEEMLRAGLEEIEEGPYGIRATVSRGKLSSEEAKKALERVRTTLVLEQACLGADLVVEAVYEDLDLKQRLFQQIDNASQPSTILASNTSTLTIGKIAAKTTRKERILGLHFFNPAQATKLVEVIRADTTSPETLEKTVDIVQKIGKTPVVARDEPGFIANRLGLAFYMEASRLVEDGIANVKDIDTAMKLGYGHPMGPFEIADLVGLDTRLRNLESLFQSTGDPRWVPPKLLRAMVSQGYIGDPSKKKGSRGGYYEFLGIRR